MTKIPNLKREYAIEKSMFQFAKIIRFFFEALFKPVLVIENCNLRFIWNLPARRLSGGVLVIWDFLLLMLV